MKANESKKLLTAVSLFTGAGGMDVGMANAGFSNLWANDFDRIACETYRLNHSNPIECGDIRNYFENLDEFKGVDLVHGGPPCQGFSVAGKMNSNDPRSELLWQFVEVVKQVKPRAFVCENVAALGRLEKWGHVRQKLLNDFSAAGYDSSFVILPAYEYGVPQKRERVFFIGLRDGNIPKGGLGPYFHAVRQKSKKVRDVLLELGRPGSPENQGICRAKITIAHSPVMRKSPYAGMLFNGAGRPLNLNDYSATMHASMGGNKTPFIDELELYENAPSWVENYHSSLLRGEKPLSMNAAPSRLRRLTVSEARSIQTFPDTYRFSGATNAQFRQIGNAVPCKLAESVGLVIKALLEGQNNEISRKAAVVADFNLF